MKKYIVCLTLLLISGLGISQTVHPDYQDGKIWFRIKKDYRMNLPLNADPHKLPVSTLPFLQGLQQSAGITNLSLPFKIAKRSDELQRTFLLEFSNKSKVMDIIRQLEATNAIDYAERVPLDKITLTPNDPSYPSQWEFSNIQASLAWNYFSTGSTIVVAIVDDAIERTHPDLAANIWINAGDNNTNGVDDDGNGYIDDRNGWDVADNDNNPNPPSSAFDHGTHVAGIAGAVSNNGVGVSSIGYSVRLMCVKSTNSSSSVTHGYDGVLYAAENGADVINMSWGGSTFSTTAENIINYAHSLGCVLIAAAGNNNVSTVFYPAGYTNVIAVAATTSSDTKASFSNYGTWIDVSAPGNNIYSTTVGASYGYKSGTSMASPMVAGLAGLMLSLNPALTNTDIRNCIQTTVNNIDGLNPGYVGQLGSGRINANLAMQCISSTLAWPPVAQFSANVTTVTAGGQVTFTEECLYSPATWVWSFPGGTPASFNGANPPPIVYNTPGTYNVTLTATNVNGSDVELKSGYITVTADGGCYGMNYPPPGTWTGVNYYTGATLGADGWINGMTIYEDFQKAMYFDASSQPYAYLNNVFIGFGRAYSSNPNKVVPIRIYDGSGGPTSAPGALLGTTNITMGQIMNDVDNSYYTEVNFITNPITLPASKRFFVAVDMTNLDWTTAKDTLSIVSNSNGQTTPSVVWEQQNPSGTWFRYTTAGTWNLSISLYIHPFLTNTPTNATFTTSATTICEDQTISFNGAGSTYEDTLLWYFPGGSPLISNNLNQTVMFNTPGNYTAILYVVGGGCSLLDSSFVNITVNPKPNVGASTTTPDICTSGSATLIATGASSYTWSPTTGLSSGSGTPVTATPATSTTYTVTGTSAAGCTNTASIEIDVNSAPIATANLSDNNFCQGSTINLDGSLSVDANSFLWTISGGTPASSTLGTLSSLFSTPGTYNVTLAVTNNCGSDNEVVSITVNPNPNPTLSLPDDSVCVSTAAITMNGSPAGGSYSGSGVSGTTFTPSVAGAGTHTITYNYVDGNGCSGSVNDNVIVNANPTVSFNFSSDTACLTAGLIPMSGTPSGGTFTGTGVSGSDFDPATAGVGTHTINYMFTDVNACSGSANDNIIVDACLGMNDEVNNQAGIVIYPNPANQHINITSLHTFSHIRLSDMSGRIVRNETMNSLNSFMLDVNDLAMGMYTIEVSNENSELYKGRIILTK